MKSCKIEFNHIHNQVNALSKAHYREHKLNIYGQMIMMHHQFSLLQLHISSMNFRLSNNFREYKFFSIERKKNCHRFYIAWEMKSEFLSLQFRCWRCRAMQYHVAKPFSFSSSLLLNYYWVKNVVVDFQSAGKT